MYQNRRVAGWIVCSALGATMLTGTLLKAQRVVPSRLTNVDDQRSSGAPVSRAPALEFTDTLVYRAPSKTRWVLGGAAAGGIVGMLLYRRSLGPYGEDFVPYISIPYFVGKFGLIGAGVGWLVAPRGRQPERAP